MQISLNIIVLLSILSFVVAIAGGAWIFLRQEAMRVDTKVAVRSMEMIRTEMLAAQEAVLLQNNKLTDAIGRLCAAESRASSFEESIRTINNKLSSRERAERKVERETQRTPPEERGDEIPGAEQQDIFEFPGFAGAAPPGTYQIPAANPQPPKRKFGVLP